MKHFLILCMLLISAAGIASSQTIEEKIGEAVQLMDNGAVGKSIVILNEVIEEEPDNYVAQYELGYAHLLNKNYRLSIDVYEKLTTHKECTASAIIALLCPNIPATNLNTNKKKLAIEPTIVTLYICFSRLSFSIDNS